MLTVKGKDAVVVQDAEAYQRLLDIAASADAEEGVRQGLENANEKNFVRQESFSASSKLLMAYHAGDE